MPGGRQRAVGDGRVDEILRLVQAVNVRGQFSLEGADALIPLLDAVVSRAAAAGCREIILGMAHRGRLNVLANIMGKRAENIFWSCGFSRV